MNVSAYVPCFNNAATAAQAVNSVLQQTIPVSEIIVINDGSTDDTLATLPSDRVRIISHKQNLGRGAARARAIQESRHDLILACDATMALPPDFLAKAIQHFQLPSVSAAFGPVSQPRPNTVAERWRGRHLFKTGCTSQLNRYATLATGGVLMRKSLVLQAGDFNPALRQGEDADLGRRLLELGCDVVFDPQLTIRALRSNSLPEVLERYRRWNHPIESAPGPLAYLKQIAYSLKVMVREDLREHDPASAAISLLYPHYLFWKCNPQKSPTHPQS